MRDDGYTLLEVIVATAILAMMAFPLLDSVRTGLYSWHLSQDHVARTEAVHLARRRLAAWIQASYPADPDRVSNDLPPMDGTRTRLIFLAPTHADTRSNDLQQVSLFITDDNYLAATLVPDFITKDGNCDSLAENICSQTPLIEGVSGIEFSYRATKDSNWTDEWQDELKLPAAVRMRLTFIDTDQQWPDLIVRTKVQSWAYCSFDSDLLACL